MTERTQVCETCAHHEDTWCHRYPQPIPVASDVHWCGEWDRKDYRPVEEVAGDEG